MTPGETADADRLRTRLAEVRERIEAAAARAGRRADDVEMVAVTKTHPSSVVAAALGAGIDDIGENRAQELVEKAEHLGGGFTGRWHFLGRVQRNKIARLAPIVSVWHSVDRVAVATGIARRSPGARIFVQVNVSGEPQKGGCDPADAAAIVETARREGLVVEGLMTVPPLGVDPRPFFAQLRELASALADPAASTGAPMGLSMGMSGDYEAAVEEGATVVRLGAALFGPRS